MSKFTRDLVEFRQGEELAKFILYEDFGILVSSEGKCPSYDLKGEYLFEVKTDRYSKKSGNICVEYQTKSGCDSGITSTKSDYYFVICYVGNLWIGCLIKTDVLRGLVFLCDRTTTYGGDRGNVKMKLIKISEVLPFAEKIYKLPKGCFIYDY